MSSSSLNRLPKGLVCYVQEPEQMRSPPITYMGDELFQVPITGGRKSINLYHLIGWYNKHVLGIDSVIKWGLQRGSTADWRPLACIFVDRGTGAMPNYLANQPLSVVLTLSAEEMEGVGKEEKPLFTPRASAAEAPTPVDRAFLSHLPRGLKCYFQESSSPVMELELYNAPWGHPKDNLFFNFGALGSGLYPESKVRAVYREKHSVLRSAKSDLECVFVSSGKHEGECLASLATLPAEELARVGEPMAKSISLRVSRLKLLPNGLKLFAAINGRIETGFDFTELQLHFGTGPVLGYRHLPTKVKASLKEAPDLLASVFNMPDYEEPPDVWGIGAFWVQEGNFKNTCLMDLLDWLDDEDLPTVGLEEVREDPLALAKGRLEAELALIQVELDKKRAEIASIEAVQQAQIEFVADERKRAVSRKELELAEKKAKSLVPY